MGIVHDGIQMRSAIRPVSASYLVVDLPHDIAPGEELACLSRICLKAGGEQFIAIE